MPAHPKPSQREGAKPKKPSSFKAKPKSDTANARSKRVKYELAKEKHATAPSRLAAKPSPAIKVGDKVTGSIVATVVAVSGQTKGALIQAMLIKGATSKELEAATGWKPHSVRGYLGTLRKAGVNVVSHKVKGEPTVYRLETAEVL